MTNNLGGISGEYLKQYIDRIEQLEEEKAGITADIRDVYSEAKGNGFDAKIMRKLIKLRKLDSFEREEQEALLDIYKNALGMLSDTPLGQASMREKGKENRRLSWSYQQQCHGKRDKILCKETVLGGK